MDSVTLSAFGELDAAGYVPSIGGWVQIAPDQDLTTTLNAFNTLGAQSLEIWLINQSGYAVAHARPDPVESNHCLRVDLETLIGSADLPFEGSVWVWSKGETDEGSIGLQAIDLDFLDRSRPDGYTAGSVHLMFDFLNTLDIEPYLDLVSPRLMAERTAEGSERYMNYLGLAHVPVRELQDASLEITVTNEDGQEWVSEPISVPVLGSWFGSLEALFPGLSDFLIPAGGSRGYGAVNVRDLSGYTIGLVCMIKVVDLLTGEMSVNHLNDRSFARPAMKDE